jgi:translation initiation factor IF-1
MSKQDCIKVEGIVTEANGDCRYTVKLTTGQEIKAQLCGKMKQNYIKCIAGDAVEVELSPYDLNHGRISRRLRSKGAPMNLNPHK